MKVPMKALLTNTCLIGGLALSLSAIDPEVRNLGLLGCLIVLMVQAYLGLLDIETRRFVSLAEKKGTPTD